MNHMGKMCERELVGKHCKMNQMCETYICKFDLHIPCVNDKLPL